MHPPPAHPTHIVDGRGPYFGERARAGHVTLCGLKTPAPFVYWLAAASGTQLGRTDLFCPTCYRLGRVLIATDELTEMA